MQAEFDEEIREFLIESNENLATLDQQIVELEKDPEDAALISSIFRTMHSIKGTCGFFGFDLLGALTHLAESILGQLRDRLRPLTPELISLILEAIDAVKVLLARIEASGEEGADETAELRERLDAAFRAGSAGDVLKDMMRVVEKKRDSEANASAVTHASAAEPRQDVINVVAPIAVEPEPAKPVHQGQKPSAATRVTAHEPAAEKPSGEITAELHVTDQTIRVDVNLLNQIMNLVGELVLTRNQLLQAAMGFSPAVQQTSQRLNVVTTELQESVMKTRMQPIGVIWNKFPRVVRDLSSKCGKQIEIEMLGAETELDKSLIEAIRDPLTHIVRNSCDHGIETPAERQNKGKSPVGKLCLRAFHEAGAVNIEISDDGAGINPDKVRAKAVEKMLITPEQAAAMSPMEAVNLIFLPGFSTASQITSLSGRGVGMDVVRTNIEKISGSVEVVLLPQGGTSIRIKIPLTLAIIPGLIVSSRARHASQQADRFVIPQSHLVEMTRVNRVAQPCPVEQVHGAAIFRHRSKLLPLVYLSRLLKRADGDQPEEEINIIVLQVAGRQFGLVVDQICDTQEIVVKPLGQQLKHFVCYGGATIMGDGKPALILDVGGIAKLAGLDVTGHQGTESAAPTKAAAIASELLLFRAGKHRRLSLPLSIVNRLEEIPVQTLEHAAGQPVLPYRGELLPLLFVAAFLEGNDAPELPEEGDLKVIVIHNGSRRVGLVVDEILDIVEGSLEMMRSSGRRGLLGSAVIGGSVTDLLDASAMQSATTRQWSRAATGESVTHRVLMYDDWPLSRQMMQTFLSSAGFSYEQASSAGDLRTALSSGSVDALLAVDNGDGLPAWWSNARREDTRLLHVPQLLLKNTEQEAELAAVAITGSDAVLQRDQRAEMLHTLQRIARRPAQTSAEGLAA